MIDNDPIGDDARWRHLDAVEKIDAVHRWIDR